MHLFLDTNAAAPIFTLPEDESRHAVSVLRLGAGDTLHVADGRGTLYECRVEEPLARACVVRVIKGMPDWERRPYRLTLAVAPTKNPDRTEWLLEKATEIGVDRIVPLVCANSERRTVFKPERLTRVIASAAKQSLKTSLPSLDALTPFRELVDGSTGSPAGDSTGSPAGNSTSSSSGRPLARLIAHCRTETPRAAIGEAFAAGQDVMVLIGPEGDFTAEEIALAESAGFRSVSLGASRLRTETAALTAVTAIYLKN